jgi:spore coat polysaccharide biosynthesis protein SpsF
LNKVVAIIQARMGSSRLPGKILKPVLGKTLLEYQLNRIERIKQINEIVVATTTNEIDNKIVDLCNRLSIPFFRGPEEDVLKRYYDTAKQYGANTIVRLTSDCPVIDPIIIENTINYYLNNNFDYVSNTLERTFPRGMDTEVFSFQALERAFNEGEEKHFREHVTPYIYQNPDIFKLGSFYSKKDNSQYRLTVDTQEDFDLIEKIILNLYPRNNQFNLNAIIDLLTEKPELVKINAHIEQKKLGSNN